MDVEPEQRLKLHKEIKQLEKALYDLHKPKLLYTYMRNGKPEYGYITKLWQQFEEELFYVSRADGKLSVRELKQMNLIEYYTHKALLKKTLKRNKQHE